MFCGAIEWSREPFGINVDDLRVRQWCSSAFQQIAITNMSRESNVHPRGEPGVPLPTNLRDTACTGCALVSTEKNSFHATTFF